MTPVAVPDARVAPGKGNDAVPVIQRAESVAKRLCKGCERAFAQRRRNQVYCRAACRFASFQQRKSAATTSIGTISPAPDGDADDDRAVRWSRMGFE